MSAGNLDLHSMSRFPFRYQDAITFFMKYRRIYTLDLFEGSFTFDFSCPPSTYVTGVRRYFSVYESVYITYVLLRTPETRYYWITFLIRLSATLPPLFCSSQPSTVIPAAYPLYFRIPNEITMQEISFVIYARPRAATNEHIFAQVNRITGRAMHFEQTQPFPVRPAYRYFVLFPDFPKK